MLHTMQDQPALPMRSVRNIALEDDCVVRLCEGLLERDHDALARRLIDELPWVQELYPRGGRFVPAPRLTSFHGDPDASYSYSGVRYEPKAWSPLLASLRDRVREEVACPFNCVLANLYRDGSDSVGYHADDEPELGPRRDDIVVASLSLGATRRFVLKRKRGGARHQLSLPGGSLLVMRGRTQHVYVHALPKTRRPVPPRVNLTFRVVGTSQCKSERIDAARFGMRDP